MKNLQAFVSTIENQTYTVYATCATEAKKTFELQQLMKDVYEKVNLEVEEKGKTDIVVQAHC